METIYPNPNGQTVIPHDKLEKAIAKGQIRPDDPNAEKELDQDMDERIDKCIREVWAHYDPKGTGVLPKKIVQRFFKDALELYALRLGRKSSKDVIAPGVNSSQAMETAYRMVTSNPNQVTFQEFENFLNCYDLEEALGPWLNINSVNVTKDNVQWVDTTQFRQAAEQPKKVVYRDRSQLQD